MRCTKCHYLSFEPEARCKNCGHDLSMDDLGAIDLPLVTQAAEPDLDETFKEFDLADTALRPSPWTPPRSSAATAVALAPATSELPLFVRQMPDAEADEDMDEPEPMVRVPARPRAPIAVRRATPDPARLRAKYAPPERDLLDDADDAADEEDISPVSHAPSISRPAPPQWASEPTPERLPAAWQQPVAAGTRLAAAAIDAGLLGAIAVTVVMLTLRIANLSVSSIGILPIVPIGAFLLLIAAGYLLLFTAAQGQTLGKMVMHIRVVGTSPDAVINDRVTIAQAAVRAAAALPSVLMLGAGFIPALMGAGLSVHDRIAHTRVVRM